MNSRLNEIIKYKTGGRKNEFAALCGWTPQYLQKLLRGENFGIQPVLTILGVLPEINARWFLLGQGDMLEIGKLYNLQREAFAHIQSLLEIEKFVPFMSPEDLHEFERAVTSGRSPVFSPENYHRGKNRQVNDRSIWTQNLRQQTANRISYADRRQPTNNTPFFEAIYYLKQAGEIRGKKTFTDEFGINLWNLNSLEKDLSRDIFQPAWLTYLVNKYGVSATWLLTGRGEIRPKHKHTAGSQP